MPINENDKPLFTLTRKIDMDAKPFDVHMNDLLNSLANESGKRLDEEGYTRDSEGRLHERIYPELQQDEENDELRLVVYRSVKEGGHT